MHAEIVEMSEDESVSATQSDFRRLLIYIFMHYRDQTLKGLLQIPQHLDQSVEADGGAYQPAMFALNLKFMADFLGTGGNEEAAALRLQEILTYSLTGSDVAYLKLVCLCFCSYVHFSYEKRMGSYFRLRKQRMDCDKFFKGLIDKSVSGELTQDALQAELDDVKNTDGAAYIIGRDDPVPYLDGAVAREADIGLIFPGDTLLHLAIRTDFPVLNDGTSEEYLRGKLWLAAAILSTADRAREGRYIADLCLVNEMKHNALHELALARSGIEQLMRPLLRLTALHDSEASPSQIWFSNAVCTYYCGSATENEVAVEHRSVPRMGTFTGTGPVYGSDAIEGLNPDSQYATACRVLNFKGVFPWYLSALLQNLASGVCNLFLPDERAYHYDMRGHEVTRRHGGIAVRSALDTNRKSPLELRYMQTATSEILDIARRSAASDRVSAETILSLIASVLNFVFSVVSEVDFCEQYNTTGTCESAPLGLRITAGILFMLSILLGFISYNNDYSSWAAKAYHYYRGNSQLSPHCLSSNYVVSWFSPGLKAATGWLICSVICSAGLEAWGLGSDNTLLRAGLTGGASIFFSNTLSLSTSAVKERTKVLSLMNARPY